MNRMVIVTFRWTQVGNGSFGTDDAWTVLKLSYQEFMSTNTGAQGLAPSTFHSDSESLKTPPDTGFDIPTLLAGNTWVGRTLRI